MPIKTSRQHNIFIFYTLRNQNLNNERQAVLLGLRRPHLCIYRINSL